jgi:hypothetical protein
VGHNKRRFCFITAYFWILPRNHFSFRKITSFGQEDNRRPQEIKETVLKYFETFNHKLNKMSSQPVVYNMDETPIYIDMMQFSHIIINWRNNTEAYTTGNLKTKISVVITISTEGTVLRGMANLKGLKNLQNAMCQIIYLLRLLNQEIWIKT